jgi:hypothetical protein
LSGQSICTHTCRKDLFSIHRSRSVKSLRNARASPFRSSEVVWGHRHGLLSISRAAVGRAEVTFQNRNALTPHCAHSGCTTTVYGFTTLHIAARRHLQTHPFPPLRHCTLSREIYASMALRKTVRPTPHFGIRAHQINFVPQLLSVGCAVGEVLQLRSTLKAYSCFDPRRTQWQPPGEPVRLPERMHQGSQNASRPRAG